MVSSKGKQQHSVTSRRPVLKTKKSKKQFLTHHDVAVQEKISKRGFGKKSPAPIGNIALKTHEDEKFKKKTKLFQKRKPKVIKRSPKDEDTPGIICISNLPHGFFKTQLAKFFGQFGDVNRVRLVRSKITGRSCGYAYVEFAHSIVARIAAKTMNNYLTYGKLMKCIYIDYTENKANKLLGGGSCLPRTCPKVRSRSRAIFELNAKRTEEQTQSREKRAISNFNRKLKQLQALGVNLDLQLENPKLKKSEKTKEKKEDKVIFEADESDDEITIKTPPNTKKKLVKITPTSPANRLSGVVKGKAKSLKKSPKTKQPLTKKTPRKEQPSAKTPRTKQPLAKKTPRKEQPSAKILFKKGKDIPTSANVSVSASGKAHKVIKDKPKQQPAVSDKKRRKSVQGAHESGISPKRKRRSL